ncbi:MAG: HNH endonuclease [Tabrizicola sp.]
MLIQKRLHEILRYDPGTGIFTWTCGKRKGQVAGTRHNERGDLKVSIDNRRYLLHRLAWLWMTGAMPRWDIAHANGDHVDNRWGNLVEANRMQHSSTRGPMRLPTGIEGIWSVGDRFEATDLALCHLRGMLISAIASVSPAKLFAQRPKRGRINGDSKVDR